MINTLRVRFALFMRARFNPARWAAGDGVVGMAGLVLAVAVFLPWFRATLSIAGSATTGILHHH